jgi:hypothetical protein
MSVGWFHGRFADKAVFFAALQGQVAAERRATIDVALAARSPLSATATAMVQRVCALAIGLMPTSCGQP